MEAPWTQRVGHTYCSILVPRRVSGYIKCPEHFWLHTFRSILLLFGVFYWVDSYQFSSVVLWNVLEHLLLHSKVFTQGHRPHSSPGTCRNVEQHAKYLGQLHRIWSLGAYQHGWLSSCPAYLLIPVYWLGWR
jgi:hypothetical protein